MKQITYHCRDCGEKVEEFCSNHPTEIVDSISSEVVNKHYVYGSGMFGCLYDYGPNFCNNLEGSIDDLVFLFKESISADELVQMKTNLRKNGKHDFRDPQSAGAQYCDVSESDGPMPESEDD